MPEPLRFVIRTPHEIALDEAVHGARVPTESGQVGLRPREEPLVLVVSPGLILVSRSDGLRFAATVGGLLGAGRRSAVLYTPFAVTGDSETDVLAALDAALRTPDSEILARRRLGELEQHILRELRGGAPPAPTKVDVG